MYCWFNMIPAKLDGNDILNIQIASWRFAVLISIRIRTFLYTVKQPVGVVDGYEHRRKRCLKRSFTTISAKLHRTDQIYRQVSGYQFGGLIGMGTVKNVAKRLKKTWNVHLI